MAAYSSTEIVDIILVLDEAERNYCRAERLYGNRYPFRRHSNAMQIRRILLRERRRIYKRNRKQINVEDDVSNPRVLAVLAMINLNPHFDLFRLGEVSLLFVLVSSAIDGFHDSMARSEEERRYKS